MNEIHMHTRRELERKKGERKRMSVNAQGNVGCVADTLVSIEYSTN